MGGIRSLWIMFVCAANQTVSSAEIANVAITTTATHQTQAGNTIMYSAASIANL